MAIKPLNSVAGFSVGETPSNIILANGDVTTTNITTTGLANLNAIGNVKVTGGSSGQVLVKNSSTDYDFSWTTFTGRRMVRACSFRDCKMDCLIHHTAYEINLNFFDQSKF